MQIDRRCGQRSFQKTRALRAAYQCALDANTKWITFALAARETTRFTRASKRLFPSTAFVNAKLARARHVALSNICFDLTWERSRARSFITRAQINYKPVHSLAFVLTSGGHRNAERTKDETFRGVFSRVDHARENVLQSRKSSSRVALERRRGKITELDNESCQIDSLCGRSTSLQRPRRGRVRRNRDALHITFARW